LREFDELWEELLEGELGSLRPSAPILAEESWEVLLANPGLDEVRRIVRAYCALSLPEPLPWERGLEVHSSEARELLESSGELLARVGPVQKRAYEERVPPALALMRELASAGETLDPKLREEASRLAAKPRPAPTKATPEADKPRFKDCMRRLWKLMEALRLLPAHGEIELLERLCEAAGARFRERKARAGLLEFQDCLSLTLALLRSDLRVRETLRARYKQILVDEFQDTDPLQYDILFFLAQRGELSTGDLPRSVPLERGKLCVVGDPRQSIYRFRGADMSAFEEATGRILAEHGRRLDLTVNFRSSAIVLRMVNRMMSSCIREQPGIQPAYEALVPAGAPTLFDLAGDAEVELLHLPPVGLAGTRRATEARVLARAVQEHMQRPGARFADVAFLFRSFSDVDLYARELRRRGIPVLVEGGRRFYERHEVERFVALLRVLVRPWDEAALLAYLRSPLGALPDPVLLAFVREGGRFRHLTAEEPPEEAGAELRDALSLLRKLRRAVTDLPPDEALRWVLRESGLAAIEAAGYDGAQRLANLEKLVSMVASWCAEDARSLDEAIERLERESKALLEMEESPLADPELNAVRLLTVHKAKGLEFELVVVPDLGWEPARHRDERLFEAGAGGKLLYRFSTMQASSLVRQEEIDEAHEAAEEQRLLYVAMTRAKQKLVLSLAEPGRARLSSLPWASSLAALGFDPEAPPADGAVLGEVLR
ncbi:MAG: UvrD-helicase domain-containing protein, partial [Planctomycetota bacterium]